MKLEKWALAFMAEEDGKTEEPTDRKLQKAREDGNVPKSEDLNGFMGVLFAVLTSFLSIQ